MTWLSHADGGTGHPADPRRRAGRCLGALGVVLLTFLCFRPVLRNGFVDWDDAQIVLDGQGPGTGEGATVLHALGEAWRTARLGEYMPLTWTSYALDRMLWGRDPFGYHLTSLLLHVLAALAVYALALRLIPGGLPWVVGGAALAALGFSLHPLRVEAVAWVSARGTVLGSLLLFSAVLAYVTGARHRPGRALAAPWLALSLGCYVASLLSRATGAVLPAVLVLLDLYPLGRLGGSASRERGAGGWPIWREKLWFLAPAVASGAMAVVARSWSGDPERRLAFAPGVAILDALNGPAFYLWRTLAPFGLSPVYERPECCGAAPVALVAGAAATVAITAALVAVRRPAPGALVAWLSSLALLLPVSGLVPGSLVHLAADRYSYAATVPWVVAGGGAAAILLPVGRRRGRVWAAALVAMAVVAVLAAWAGLARRQIAIWRDPDSLWTQAAAVTPESAVARFNLAVVRERQGRLADALAGYRAAARVWPGFAPVHVALGQVLARCGQLGPARAELETAVQLKPNDGQAHAALGTVLLASGDSGAAVAELTRALALDPGMVVARRDLAAARERLRSRPASGTSSGGVTLMAGPAGAGCW